MLRDDIICKMAGPYLIFSDVAGDEAQVLISDIVFIDQHPPSDADQEEWVAHFILRSEKAIKTKVPYRLFTKTINDYFCYEKY